MGKKLSSTRRSPRSKNSINTSSNQRNSSGKKVIQIQHVKKSEKTVLLRKTLPSKKVKLKNNLKAHEKSKKAAGKRDPTRNTPVKRVTYSTVNKEASDESSGWLSSDDDSDIFYSLPDNPVTEPSESKSSSPKQSRSKANKDDSPGSSKNVQLKKLQVKLNPILNQLISNSDSPSTDSEVSFKIMDIKKRPRLLKGGSSSVKVKPVQPQVTQYSISKKKQPSPPNTLPLPRFFNGPNGCAAPASAEKSKPCQRGRPMSASPSKSVDSFWCDLPTVPVIPIIPSSPSAASYKALMNSFPKTLQANRGMKRKLADDDEVVRRISVRQSESVFKYKEIVVKKSPGYTQIWLFTNTKAKNALNPTVFQELVSALNNAKYDDSRLVMLSGSGSVFCSGIDLYFLLSNDRKTQVQIMANAVRTFLNALISFPKPVVAAVNGPAIGLGVAILGLCDIVYASDKASFYTPYGRLNQTPEGCSSYLFPQIMGMAMANEMLLGGRKLTAIEAYQIGLVSQVFWPTSMMQEVVPRLENIAAYSAKALEASKMLIRSHQRAKLEFTLESEMNLLQERWGSSDCQKAISSYLEDEQDLLF